MAETFTKTIYIAQVLHNAYTCRHRLNDKENMIPITPIQPYGITLLATLRCTAACDNCCFGCNPQQGRSMTYEEMKDYVD